MKLRFLADLRLPKTKVWWSGAEKPFGRRGVFRQALRLFYRPQYFL